MSNKQISPETQVVLLLCLHLGKQANGSEEPLTQDEWNRVVLWLKQHDKDPTFLLQGDVEQLVSDIHVDTLSTGRVKALLRRGVALAFSLEKWQRASIWVMTKSDSEYPKNTILKLKAMAPSVIFGCGDSSLLNQGQKISVVGPEQSSKESLDFAYNLGAGFAERGISVISSCNDGIGHSCMFGALENGGKAIGVVGKTLIKSISSSKYRKHIMDSNMMLLSPFHPEEKKRSQKHKIEWYRQIYSLADLVVLIGGEKTEKEILEVTKSHILQSWGNLLNLLPSIQLNIDSVLEHLQNFQPMSNISNNDKGLPLFNENL